MKILDKDIPILPILQFIAYCTDGLIPNYYQHCGRMDIFTPNYAVTGVGFPHSLCKAFPNEDKTSEQTIHTKMKRLLAAGLVDGCNCGCKGEFTITDAGRAFILSELDKLKAKK